MKVVKIQGESISILTVDWLTVEDCRKFINMLPIDKYWIDNDQLRCLDANTERHPDGLCTYSITN